MLKSRSFFVFSAIVLCSSAWAQGLTPLEMQQGVIEHKRGKFLTGPTAGTKQLAEKEPDPASSPSLRASAGPSRMSSRVNSAKEPNLANLTVEPDGLSSPSVAQGFYEAAYELANSAGVMRDAYRVKEKTQDARRKTQDEIEQAIVFLTATMNLDSRANYAVGVLIRCLAKSRAHLDQDEKQDARARLVYQLLVNYVDKSTDLELAREAVLYLLDHLDSRSQREKFLEGLLKNISGKNTGLDSELATLLGLLKAEKTDVGAAQFYFMKAYNKNKYNKLAFAKLAELQPGRIEPAYIEHLRLALGENPLDMKASLAFAQYAERLQLYQTAADTYQYCTDLFSYLYPYEPLPASLYLPWAINSYNTQHSRHRCLQIARSIRQSGHFDLLLEAIAARAAVKVGDSELASRIFQLAQDRAQQLQEITDRARETQSQVRDTQLAWFYCFALPDADKALDWANKAYSNDANSATAAALLAYSLVMNGQAEWAKPLIDSYDRNQIADLALAKIQLEQGQRSAMIETLKLAIARDPGSLVAEHAKELLAEHGQKYTTPIDTDAILAVLRNSTGGVIVPTFTRPDKIISVQLKLRGSKFSYGSEFGGTIAIKNNSTEPLVISDDGLFKGNIRVDAAIRGDIDKKIPNLVSVKIRPASQVGPGETLFIPLRLFTGELKQTLLTYPQASLDIEFTAYLDPVTTDDGRLTSRLAGIKPARVVAKRPGIELTTALLQNQFNWLKNGPQSQKIKAAQLFIGLLAEQHAMANRQQLYKFRYANWIPAVLKSSLMRNLADDDWVVKVHTMAAMFPLPLDFKLTNAVAANLNDTRWPVRMMAVYLLAKNQGRSFNKVLGHTAERDPSKLVRDMANTLGTSTPQGR